MKNKILGVVLLFINPFTMFLLFYQFRNTFEDGWQIVFNIMGFFTGFFSIFAFVAVIELIFEEERY